MGCPLVRQTSTDDSSSIKKRKILLLGLDNSGKTTILNQLKHNKFQQTAPTVGLNVESLTYKNLDFTVFDVGGKIKTLWQHYYDNTDALIFVIDSTDKERLWIIKNEIMKINEDLKFSNTVLLVLFNKQDRSDIVEYPELLENTGVIDIMEADVIVQKCSGKTGKGVFEALDKLINFMIMSEKGRLSYREESQTIVTESMRK
jgi:small GTP-binding protein